MDSNVTPDPTTTTDLERRQRILEKVQDEIIKSLNRSELSKIIQENSTSCESIEIGTRISFTTTEIAFTRNKQEISRSEILTLICDKYCLVEKDYVKTWVCCDCCN